MSWQGVLAFAIVLAMFSGPLTAFVVMAESVAKAREKKLWNKFAAYGDWHGERHDTGS